MSTLTFDQAITEIKTAATRGPIELYDPQTNTSKEVPLWRADTALVQNEGIIIVGGLRFVNDGNRGVTMN